MLLFKHFSFAQYIFSSHIYISSSSSSSPSVETLTPTAHKLRESYLYVSDRLSGWHSLSPDFSFYYYYYFTNGFRGALRTNSLHSPFCCSFFVVVVECIECSTRTVIFFLQKASYQLHQASVVCSSQRNRSSCRLLFLLLSQLAQVESSTFSSAFSFFFRFYILENNLIIDFFFGSIKINEKMTCTS